MKRRWQVLDTNPSPVSLSPVSSSESHLLTWQKKLQMMGAEPQDKALDLLVRYSFHPLLNFVWSSSQRDYIGHNERSWFLHNGRSETRTPVITDG